MKALHSETSQGLVEFLAGLSLPSKGCQRAGRRAWDWQGRKGRGGGRGGGLFCELCLVGGATQREVGCRNSNRKGSAGTSQCPPTLSPAPVSIRHACPGRWRLADAAGEQHLGLPGDGRPGCARGREPVGAVRRQRGCGRTPPPRHIPSSTTCNVASAGFRRPAATALCRWESTCSP